MDIINIFNYFPEILKILNYKKNIKHEFEVVELEIIEGDDL
jgi:hypothetical protein